MKILITAPFLVAFGLSVLGQGEVYLNNHIPGQVEAPISRPDGTGAGAGMSAELMLVQPGDTLLPLGPATTFRTTSAAAAYYINPIVVTIPGMLPGALIIVRLVAFNGKDFATSTLTGESSDISVTLGGGVILPPNLTGLQGFTLTSGQTKPAITTNPQSQTVAAGASVTFSVVASGTAPLTYQWQKNDHNVSGAVSSALTLSPVSLTDAGTYKAIVQNSAGSATSKVATLSVLAPPHVSVAVHDLTISLGSAAVFSVQASGSGLAYQWQHGGSNIPGATTASLKMEHVKASDAGVYQVTISNSAGKVTSSGVLTVGGVSFVQRQLPSGYTAGTKLVVTLNAQPASSTQVYVVQDQPPAGWTVGTISDDGVFDSVNNEVKFGPFLTSGAQVLTYEITPTPPATGAARFQGTAIADGLTSLIAGDDTVSSVNLHPADNNPADQRLTAVEVTAYTAAWKHGDSWAVGPSPIPAAYVSRAGALWRGGEFYKLDSSVASGPPRWWVNTTSSLHIRSENSGVGVALASQDSAQGVFMALVPDKYVPGIPTSIACKVIPPGDALSYVVEVSVPMGWTVSDINDDGSFDLGTQKIKWGLFFDKKERELSFSLVAPAESTGPLQLTGVASFDGQDVLLSGNTQGVASSKMGNPHRNKNGDLDLDLTGSIGQNYAIEVSTDLIHWTQVKTFQNLNGLLGFEDSNASALKQKFFRAVIVP